MDLNRKYLASYPSIELPRKKKQAEKSRKSSKDDGGEASPKVPPEDMTLSPQTGRPRRPTEQLEQVKIPGLNLSPQSPDLPMIIQEPEKWQDAFQCVEMAVAHEPLDKYVASKQKEEADRLAEEKRKRKEEEALLKPDKKVQKPEEKGIEEEEVDLEALKKAKEKPRAESICVPGYFVKKGYVFHRRIDVMEDKETFEKWEEVEYPPIEVLRKMCEPLFKGPRASGGGHGKDGEQAKEGKEGEDNTCVGVMDEGPYYLIPKEPPKQGFFPLTEEDLEKEEEEARKKDLEEKYPLFLPMQRRFLIVFSSVAGLCFLLALTLLTCKSICSDSFRLHDKKPEDRRMLPVNISKKIVYVGLPNDEGWCKNGGCDPNATDSRQDEQSRDSDDDSFDEVDEGSRPKRDVDLIKVNCFNQYSEKMKKLSIPLSPETKYKNRFQISSDAISQLSLLTNLQKGDLKDLRQWPQQSDQCCQSSRNQKNSILAALSARMQSEFKTNAGFFDIELTPEAIRVRPSKHFPDPVQQHRTMRETSVAFINYMFLIQKVARLNDIPPSDRVAATNLFVATDIKVATVKQKNADSAFANVTVDELNEMSKKEFDWSCYFCLLELKSSPKRFEVQPTFLEEMGALLASYSEENLVNYLVRKLGMAVHIATGKNVYYESLLNS